MSDADIKLENSILKHRFEGASQKNADYSVYVAKLESAILGLMGVVEPNTQEYSEARKTLNHARGRWLSSLPE